MNRKIFVGSIPVTASKQQVKEYFMERAQITNFSIIVKRKKKNFICGILQCKDEKNAKIILSQTHFFEGVQLECHPFMRGNKLKYYKSHTFNKNVYVANIPYECEESDIWEIFKKYGEIEKIRFLHSHRHKEKYAIVTFHIPQTAEKVLNLKKVAGFNGFVKIKRYKSGSESSFNGKKISKTNGNLIYLFIILIRCLQYKQR